MNALVTMAPYRRGVGLLVVAFIALLLAETVHAQEIYRWVDEAGQVHFGTTPPADAVIDEVQPPPPPALDESSAKEQREQFLQAHEQAEAARQERLEASAKAEEEASRRAEACQRARQRVSTLELNRRIVDEQGNTLDDTVRLERLDNARQQVADNCA